MTKTLHPDSLAYAQRINIFLEALQSSGDIKAIRQELIAEGKKLMVY
ncbi:MAG: hypothetical protein MK132_16780 [Lentisphaerales bacterium]|nr:hypothetical protein [Lentisphaerales bacterium]